MNKVLIAVMGLLVFVLSGCRPGSVKTGSFLPEDSQAGLIALTRLTDGYWQIWTMKPDGSEARQVTDSASDKRYPSWSADGQRVFFRNSDNQAWSVNLSDGSQERVFPSLGMTSGVVPSPDGSTFVMMRYRRQLTDSGGIWLVGQDGLDTKLLTSSSGIQYDPFWSPDGKWIVYISSHGYMTDEVCIMEVSSKEERKLTNNSNMEFLPTISPDGRTIAYVSDVTGDYEIWLMNVDGSDERPLTKSAGIDTRPFWSPDGSKIVFVSNRSGSLQLWLMDVDGSHQRQLTDDSPSMDPAWKGY